MPDPSGLCPLRHRGGGYTQALPPAALWEPVENPRTRGSGGWALTAVSGGPSGPLFFCWTMGFVLTGDSGCPRAGLGEGLAGWGAAFFSDSSSSWSEEGLFTPAMPPTGRRHTGQRAQPSPTPWLWVSGPALPGSPGGALPTEAEVRGEGAAPASSGSCREGQPRQMPSWSLASPPASPPFFPPSL